MGGSAPARVLEAGGRGQYIVSPSSRSASSASVSTMPTYCSSVASTTERTASRNAAEGAHARTAAGSSSSGISSRAATASRSGGDAPVDTLRDHRAGCPHERPELGVVELVEHPGDTYSSSRPSRPAGWLRGPTPERASRPTSIAGWSAAPNSSRWRSAASTSAVVAGRKPRPSSTSIWNSPRPPPVVTRHRRSGIPRSSAATAARHRPRAE